MDKERGNDDGEDGASAAAGNDTEAVRLFWRRTLEGRRKKPLSDIVSFNHSGNRIPLYLFPSVALGPTEFLELGKYFDPEQPWHILIPPMKEFKQGPEGLIKEIASHFSERLDEMLPRGRSIAVGGWSAGVTPALELARQLRARGRDVPLLIAIDMAPENTGVAERRKSLYKRIKSIIHDSRQQGKNRLITAIDLPRTILGRGIDKILLRRQDIITLLHGYTSIPPEDVVQIRRFYAAAFACSRPEPYDGKVLVIEAGYELNLRVRAKWETFASNVEAVVIEGTHPSIVRWKDAAKLGEVINSRLNALSSPHGATQPLRDL